MLIDPIVEEVRKFREEIAAECHFDPGKFSLYLKKAQSSGSHELVNKDTMKTQRLKRSHDQDDTG